MFKKIKFNHSKYNLFFYNIDIHNIIYSKYKYLENFSVDYSIILENGLLKLKNKDKSNYSLNKNILIDGICDYIDSTIKYLNKSSIENRNEIINWFKSIKNSNVKHFDEALQRILFYNQLMWQTGHVLVGLGRLDKILIKYYKDDIDSNYIKKEDASKMVNSFLCLLHEYYWYKSNTLLGDTGQIIILGGKDKNDKYLDNELTYIFIEELKRIHYPDPKILLRVSNNIPRKLLEDSVDCIKTGIGSPLFANDDVIIQKMIDFGYKKEDAFNYAASACWEPLVPGKAAEQNNLNTLVFMDPFNKMLINEDLNNICSIDELLNKYNNYIQEYVDDVINKINEFKYEKDPYVSLFISDCDKKKMDITECYGVYNYSGLTTVSLGNVINSIININELVFKEKKYTFNELNSLRKKNFDNDEKIISLLKSNKKRYGLDDKEIIDLSNRVMDLMSKAVSKNKIHGGKIKIGYSAPSYISHSLNQYASFDGRKDDGKSW